MIFSPRTHLPEAPRSQHLSERIACCPKKPGRSRKIQRTCAPIPRRNACHTKGGPLNNDAVWVRGVTGIQLHHVTNLQDAGRLLGNAAMALHAAHVRTGDDRYSSLATQLKTVAVQARQLESEARDSMHGLNSTDPERFVRCRDGQEPWPDEIQAGFVPRHTCKDECLYHDHDVLDAIMQCTCGRPACRACAIGGKPKP